MGWLSLNSTFFPPFIVKGMLIRFFSSEWLESRDNSRTVRKTGLRRWGAGLVSSLLWGNWGFRVFLQEDLGSWDVEQGMRSHWAPSTPIPTLPTLCTFSLMLDILLAPPGPPQKKFNTIQSVKFSGFSDFGWVRHGQDERPTAQATVRCPSWLWAWSTSRETPSAQTKRWWSKGSECFLVPLSLLVSSPQWCDCHWQHGEVVAPSIFLLGKEHSLSPAQDPWTRALGRLSSRC